MKSKLAVVLLLSFLFFSCRHLQQKNNIAADTSCNAEKIEELYFSDWEGCVECAHSVITLNGADKDVQIAQFILGEEKFLKGNDKESFDYFLNALYGPDADVAEASLSYIKRTDLTFDQISSFVNRDTDTVTHKPTRLSIDLERLKWALATDRKAVYSEIFSQISIPGGFKLAKAIDTNDEKTEIPDKFSTGYEVKNIRLNPGNGINLEDHFSDVDGNVFYLVGDFYLPDETDLSIHIKTGMKYGVFIDGNLLKKDRGLPVLSQGNHRVVIRLPGDKKDNEVAVSISFYDSGVSTEREGELDGTYAFKEDESVDETSFSKYIGLLTGNNVSIEDYFNIYSNVLGSFSPPFIYNLALKSLDDRSVERGLNYLKRIAEEKHFLRPVIEIKEWLLYSGRKKELDDFEEEFPPEKDNVLSRLFELDRLSFEKQYLAGLVKSEKFFNDFRNYPASYYYFAGACEEFGDLNRALKIRLGLLKKLPYHMPLLTSIEVIAGQLGKNALVAKVLKRKITRDSQRIKFRMKLAEIYFRNREYDKADMIYSEILNSLSTDLSALIGKGDVAFVKGCMKKAKQFYLRAFILYPESSIASKKASLFGETDYSAYFKKYSRTDDEILKMAKEYKGKDELPYVVIYDEGGYRIVNHNLIVARFRMLIKVNTENGVKEFVRTRYSGELLSARIIRDGKIIKVQKTEKDIVDFSSLRPGDFIDYSFLTKDRNDHWLDGFNDSWLFGNTGTHYVNSEVSVYVPDGMKFNYFISKGVRGPEIKKEEGGQIYFFKKTNTFFPPEEKYMPELYKVIPNLRFSVINSWKDFAKWQMDFIREGGAVKPSIEEKTFSIIKSSDDPITVIRKLRDFVAREVRYRSIDPGELRVRPESAEQTLKRMSGDCKDKTLLLKTMLHAAGIKARYALIRSKFAGSFTTQVPSMQFDHALVFIPGQKGIKSEGFFLDPTSGYDSFMGLNRALIGVKAMVIDDEKASFGFTEVKENAEGVAEFLIKSSGLSSAVISGTAASMIRFNLVSGKSPTEVLSRFFLNKDGNSQEIDQVEVEDGKLNDPLVIKFNCSGMFPSVVSAVYGEISKIKSRYYALELPYLSERISFVIKKNKKVNFTQNNKFFSYSVQSEEGGVVKMDFVIKKWTIDSEEFAELEKYVINVMMFERDMKEGTDG